MFGCHFLTSFSCTVVSWILARFLRYSSRSRGLILKCTLLELGEDGGSGPLAVGERTGTVS